MLIQRIFRPGYSFIGFEDSRVDFVMVWQVGMQQGGGCVHNKVVCRGSNVMPPYLRPGSLFLPCAFTPHPPYVETLQVLKCNVIFFFEGNCNVICQICIARKKWVQSPVTYLDDVLYTSISLNFQLDENFPSIPVNNVADRADNITCSDLASDLAPGAEGILDLRLICSFFNK